jgi:hypothetical protein
MDATRKCILLAASFIALAGCKAVSPYHPYNSTCGYSESPVAKDTYEVIFVGTRWMNEIQVQRYATVRCAELTLQNGGRYFEIQNRETFYKKVSKSVSGETTITEETVPGKMPGAPPRKKTTITEDPPQHVTYAIPNSKIVFKIVDSETVDSLDATEVMANARADGTLPPPTY